MRTFNYEDEEGQSEGRDVYVADHESSVLGPDGEPLRKRFGQKVGFALRPQKRKRP